MPGRTFSTTSAYRYGFNGKEQDSAINGTGVDYDYGERIFDARIGRWLSVDAVQKKYPNWSPYNFVMNSPLKLKDDNGDDVKVTIDGNSITFSSTIYITGPGASDVAKNANNSFDKFSKTALQNQTYKDVEGKIYNVQIKMNFVAVNLSDPQDANLAGYNSVLSDKVGSSGNNLINLTDNKKHLYEGTRANAGNAASEAYENTREDFVGPHGNVLSKSVVGVGNMAYLNQEKPTAENGVVAIHETFHNFGLGDRYIENVLYEWTNAVATIKSGEAKITVAYPGFEDDMMKNNSLNNFNQIHIDNLVSQALELSKTKGNSFVMAIKVDSASNTDEGSAPSTFTSGKTIYTKKENPKNP